MVLKHCRVSGVSTWFVQNWQSGSFYSPPAHARVVEKSGCPCPGWSRSKLAGWTSRSRKSPAPQRKSLEVPPPQVPQWKADFFSTNSLQRKRNKSPYSVRWSSDNQSPQLNRRSIEITSPYLRRKDDNYKDRHSADLNNLQICPEKVDNQTVGRQAINHIQSGALLASLDKSILQIRLVH